jgi:trigger factor
MQVSLETGEGLERKLTIQVPAETVDKEVETRLKSMTSRVKIDGFRPGKVPLKVVKQQYGVQVHQEVMGDVMQNTFRDAVMQEDLKLAGNPEIEPKNMTAGEALEYVATFEVYPEVEITDCSSLEIERQTAEIGDADIDKMIETLRKQRTAYNDVDRAAKNDDQLTISFTGTIDGEAFEGGSADNIPLVLGSSSMIPGFEDQLVGKSAGDELDIEVPFPDDYHVEDLKGKAAVFATKVITVAEPAMPEVDDEFAKSFGVTEGGIEKLRKDILENMQRELKNKLQTSLKNNVMDALLKANEVLVPKSLIDDECGNLQQQMTQSANLQGGMSLPKEMFADEAKRRVGLGLLIGELVKVSGVTVDQEKVTAKINDVAATYEDPQEVINHYTNNPQLKSGIEALVLEEMVVDWVIDQAKVSDTKSSFEELMKPVPGQSAA